MTGTEVERVATVGRQSADGFVVGPRASRSSKHPDADRLSVCRSTPATGKRTIVCGAPNVAAGQMVAVALPGAVLPDGTKLKKAKLRGVESERDDPLGDRAGDRRGLRRHHGPGGGTTERPKPGAALGEVLPVSQPVLELEVTSNRSDCLAIYGVAREVHAVTGRRAGRPAVGARTPRPPGEGKVTDFASVKVEVPELCPRFTARVFTDVEIGPSPPWLKARLMAAGQRPINNVVDITNYVMLMTGQPCHAFDLDEVPGGELIIRTAKDGEKMTTLDDVERELDPEMCLVSDREQAAGIAGSDGRPGLGGEREHDPGAASRSRPGTGSTSCAPRASSRCAPRPRPGSRSSCTRR